MSFKISHFSKEKLAELTVFMNTNHGLDNFTAKLLNEKIFDDPDFNTDLTVCSTCNGKLIGFGMAVLRQDGLGFIKLIAVGKHSRERGIGRAIYQVLEERLKVMGCRSIRVYNSNPNYLLPGVDPRYTPALCLFNSLGFRRYGKTYSVPIYQQMVMVDYDKAVLSKIGIKGEDIKTWGDFEEVCAKLKAQGILEYPISFGVRSWSWYLMALSMGSTLFDKNMESTFSDPDDPGYKSFAMLIDFYNKGLISPERVASPNPHPAFWAGQAAFHQAWQGSLAIANNPEKSKIAPNADYLLLPDKHFTWSLPAGLGISSYSKYPKAAEQFIEFMISEETQAYLFKTHGMFPALKSLFEKLGAEGQIEGYEVMAEQAKYLIPLPYNTPWYSEFNTEATNALVRAARGEQTVDQAIQALAEYQRKVKKEYE